MLAHSVVLVEHHVGVFAHARLAGIPMTKKKFAELELSLLHLQQNVEIPETHLIIHPIIQKAVEQVRNPLGCMLMITRLTNDSVGTR